MSATLSLGVDAKFNFSWNSEAGGRHLTSTNLAEVMSKCCLVCWILTSSHMFLKGGKCRARGHSGTTAKMTASQNQPAR